MVMGTVTAATRVGDPATTTDEEFRSAIRTEYTALRSQIEKADGICQLALAALFTAGLAMVKVATDAYAGGQAGAAPGQNPLHATAAGAAWLIAFLWLAGYLFLSEKRHVIVKTAVYISSQLEPRHPGLGWERWHLGGAEGQSFWRWDPHYLETTIAAVVLLLTLLFVMALEGAVFTPWVGITALTFLVFVGLAFQSIYYYRRAVWHLKHPSPS
jgi:hypothetical protein